jgi:hypothetical protein
MPVRRFRSIEEMSASGEAPLSGRADLRAAVAVSRTCLALARSRPPPGVYKYASVEDAWRARLQWEREQEQTT